MVVILLCMCTYLYIYIAKTVLVRKTLLEIIVFNPLSGNAPYFSILLCLTPDDFTRQLESAATQWVNKT